MKRAVVIILLVGAGALAARARLEDHEIRGAAVRRFQQVAPGLYRGGQPTPTGFEFLKWRGIKTVVNLRREHDERTQVEKLGFKYVYIPLHSWDPVSDEARKKFFDVVNDPANQPVFVHCERGADRTGVMIGFYRIAEQGWDAPRAYEEARALGMRWWYRGLKRQLYELAASRSAGNSRPAK